MDQRSISIRSTNKTAEEKISLPRNSFTHLSNVDDIDSKNTRGSGALMISDLHKIVQDSNQIISTLYIYEKLSKKIGGEIKFLEEFDFFPVLIDQKGKPISLYSFIEVIDEKIDYQDISKEFPSLTHSQINSAIEFLRKITSINIYGADIDELEEYFQENNSEFESELINSLNDKGEKRVLYNDKQSRG